MYIYINKYINIYIYSIYIHEYRQTGSKHLALPCILNLLVCIYKIWEENAYSCLKYYF